MAIDVLEAPRAALGLRQASDAIPTGLMAPFISGTVDVLCEPKMTDAYCHFGRQAEAKEHQAL